MAADGVTDSCLTDVRGLIRSETSNNQPLKILLQILFVGGGVGGGSVPGS